MVLGYGLLLSHFSRAQLCATPQTAARQAPPSLGVSRQEHWSGLPFPSPMHEVESESEVARSCPTLRDPIDRSLPGSSIHGIFQVRVLEWGSIAFSNFLSYNLFFLQIYFLFNFFKCIKQSCLKFLFISWGWQYSGYLNRCPPSTFVNFIPWPQPRFIYP